MRTNYAVQISGPGFSVTSDDPRDEREGEELVLSLSTAIEMAQAHMAGTVYEFLGSIVREINCMQGQGDIFSEPIARAEKVFIDAAFALRQARLRQREEDKPNVQPEKPAGPSGVP